MNHDFKTTLGAYMHVLNRLGRIILLTCLIQSSFGYQNDQEILINFQINQLNSQIKEYEKEKLKLDLSHNGTKTESLESKTNSIQSQLDQANANLQFFITEEMIPFEENCTDTESCQETEIELLGEKAILTEKVSKLEKSLSKLLNANQDKDQRNADLQNKFENDQKRIVEIDNQLKLLKKQLIFKKELLAIIPTKKVEKKKLDDEVVSSFPDKPVVRKVISKPIDIVIAAPKKKMIPVKLAAAITKDATDLGKKDGKLDALTLVKTLGLKHGRIDGEKDGTKRGQLLATEKSYQKGLKQGLKEGKILAEAEGNSQGIILGNKLGIEEAAIKAAEKQAEFDVEESNVHLLATRKGKNLGRDKAQREGFSVGKAKGEAHAIDKFENRSLTPIYVDGPFIGSFSPHTPAYKTSFCQELNCSKQNETLNKSKSIYLDISLQEKFKNAYQKSYFKTQRETYIEQIDASYLNFYSTQFKTAVAYHSSILDQKAYQQGLEDGIEEGKETYFALYKEQAKNESYSQKVKELDQNGIEYKKAYKKAYRKFKQKLWNRTFKQESEKAELGIYQKMIDTEVVKSKAIRFAEVSDFYEQNPILSFQYVKMKDVGIDGLGESDGIFQPGENLSHDIIIKNYGLEDANNIILITENNLRYIIKKVPASTVMHFKGVAKSVIPENYEGESYSPVLKAFYETSQYSKISSIHYENPDKDLLGSKVHSPLIVKYPLKLEFTKRNQQFLLGQKQSIAYKITNVSRKSITGPIELILESNSIDNQNSTLVNIDLAPGKTIQGHLDLNYTNQKDLYQNLYLEARILLKQIAIGSSGKHSLLIKSPSRIEDIKEKEVILLTNSNQPQTLISKLMTESNKSFGVIDSSVEKASLKATILKKKSFILIHENESDLTMNLLAKLSVTNKNSNLLVIKNGQSEVQLPSLIKSKIPLAAIDGLELTLMLYQSTDEIFPILILPPELAKVGINLSQYLTKDLSLTTLGMLKDKEVKLEYFVLKLLLELVNGSEVGKILNPSLASLVKIDFQKTIPKLDVKQLSQVYLKLKNDLQDSITTDITPEEN